MPDILEAYFDALERLKRGKPVNVSKGTKITKDSVSLEAGRKKGTIKKSRPIFNDLIEAIDAAVREVSKPQDEVRERLNLTLADAKRYRILWEEALAREVSLVKELWDAREEWEKERSAKDSGKITSIRSQSVRYPRN